MRDDDTAPPAGPTLADARAANRARMVAAGPPRGTIGSALSADEVDALLRPTVCNRCGYDLTGLPAVAGPCPECGRPYGGPEVCLYGFAAGRTRTAWTRRPPNKRQLVWQWVSSAAVVVGLSVWHRSVPFMGGWYWYLLTSTVVGLAITTWRGLSEQPSDAVQVRFTPAGVSQRSRGWGPVPYEKVDGGRPIPWRRVARLTLLEDSDGQVHVAVEVVRTFWTIQKKPVDALVRCAPPTVVALQQRVGEWRGDGRA